MAQSVQALIDITRSETAESPHWAGSDEHLALLADYITGRAAVKGVEWHSGRSEWERTSNVVRLEAPGSGKSLDDDVRRVALNAFHESTHARFSTSKHPVVVGFFAELTRLEALGASAAVDFLSLVFNRLEDERIMRKEGQASQLDIAAMEGFRADVVADAEAAYEARHHELVWTATPSDPGDQLMVALAERIHRNSQPSLHQRVRQLIDDGSAGIDNAISGEMIDVITTTYHLLGLFRDALADLHKS